MQRTQAHGRRCRSYVSSLAEARKLIGSRTAPRPMRDCKTWPQAPSREHRIAPGELIYHALNRANGRSQLFDKPEDYAAFERIMVAAMRRSPIRLLAYCLMPTHWHMVLWAKKDGEMTKCVNRGTPYGTETWKTQIAAALGLKSALHPRGRPRKQLELTSRRT